MKRNYILIRNLSYFAFILILLIPCNASACSTFITKRKIFIELQVFIDDKDMKIHLNGMRDDYGEYLLIKN